MANVSRRRRSADYRGILNPHGMTQIRAISFLLLTFTLLSCSWAFCDPHNAIWAIDPGPAISDPAAQSISPIQTVLQGEQQLEAGQYDLALRSFQQAIQAFHATGASESVSQAELGLARTYLLQGNYRAALPLFKTHSDSVYLLGLQGLTYYQMGQYTEAETVLRRAVSWWESLLSRPDNEDVDRITLIDQMAFAYRLLQKTLVAQNKTDAALEIAELGRARALVELLSQRYEGKIARSLSLAQLKQIAKTQNSTLVEYSIVGRELRVLGIEPRDETDLYIWVIQPSGTIHFRTVNLKTADLASPRELVQAMRGTVLRRGRFAPEGSSPKVNPNKLQQLYHLLIQPIADLLPTPSNAVVTFIPEGSLLLVPFAALQDPSGQYLIAHHTIRMAPSIQTLDLTHRRSENQAHSKAAPTALVVANPTMPTFPGRNGSPPDLLPPLPASEVEGQGIAALLKTQFLKGDEATKAAVLQRMPKSDLIHLATHGLLNLDANLNEFGELKVTPPKTARQSGVFLYPGVILGKNVEIGGVPAELAAARERVMQVDIPGVLALAPTAKDSGFLSAKEILKLQLTANLVVLSACNTGRGRITGDGVVGLARAFIGAGVPSVIVSLWSVPDAPTATLMLQFYKNLNLHQGMDKAQALRQAMLFTQQQYPQPIDWAAFVLVGEIR